MTYGTVLLLGTWYSYFEIKVAGEADKHRDGVSATLFWLSSLAAVGRPHEYIRATRQLPGTPEAGTPLSGGEDNRIGSIETMLLVAPLGRGRQSNWFNRILLVAHEAFISA